MRFVPVSLGALTLALTYAIARRLAGRIVGTLAMLLMILWQWTPASGPVLNSGVPLVDLSRIARYDILAAWLGLGALWFFVAARETRRRRYDFLSGLLAGLSGLAHLYGLFWIPALLVVTGVEGLRQVKDSYHEVTKAQSSQSISSCLPVLVVKSQAIPGVLMLTGAALPWSIWLGYIALNWNDFTGQFQIAQRDGRFQLSDGSFYFGNFLDEWHRYLPTGWHAATPTRAGFWLLAVGVPIALLWLIVRALRHSDRRAMWLAVPVAMLPILFALLVKLKSFNYLISVAPLFAVAIAWPIARWLRSPRRTVRLTAAGLLALVAAQGLSGVMQMQFVASRAPSSEAFFTELRRAVPPKARVLGLPQYWLGLTDREYRSFALPFYLSDPASNRDAISFEAALDRIAPQFVLIDPPVIGALTDQSTRRNRAVTAEFWSYMRRHQARLIRELREPGGTTVLVYRLDQ